VARCRRDLPLSELRKGDPGNRLIATVACHIGNSHTVYPRRGQRDSGQQSTCKGATAPILWLASVKKPTFVIEGTEKPSNIKSLQLMANKSKNANLHFIEAEGATHCLSMGGNEALAFRRNL
jgi:hypothetical protein